MCRRKFEGGMGFRDLMSFNKALVAKQGWHLLTERKLLMCRILKDEHFKHAEFLNAWQVIMWGRDLLRKGMPRKVGNG